MIQTHRQYSENKTNFKDTVLRLLEAYILVKLAELDPKSEDFEGISYSPLSFELIKNYRHLHRKTFIERYLQIPEEFLDIKYSLLQQICIKHKSNNIELNEFIKNYIPTIKNTFTLIDKGRKLMFGLAILLKKFPKKLGDEIVNNEIPNNIYEKITQGIFATNNKIIQMFSLITVAELIEKIEEDNFSLKELKEILGLSEKQILNNEYKLFETTKIPTCYPFIACIESHIRPDKWERDKDNKAFFKKANTKNNDNWVKIYISDEKNDGVLAWDAAHQFINSMDLDFVKLQLIFGSHLLQQPNSYLAKFTLKGTEIIEQLGWEKKHRYTNSDKLNKIANIALYLSRILITCNWIIEDKNAIDKLDLSFSNYPLWNIEIDIIGPRNIITKQVDNPDEVYITVSPGQWTEKWLNNIGKRDGYALHQYGFLTTKILKFDSKYKELPLKIAIYVTKMSRIQLASRNQYIYRVGTILEAVEPAEKISKARNDCRAAYNLKQEWDKALKFLDDMGWKVEPNKDSYPVWLRSDSKAEKPQDTTKENIINQLWEAKLKIVPPEPIPTELQGRVQSRQINKNRSTKPTSTWTGADIRQMREAIGISQTDLAKLICEDRQWLCMVEKGKRKINSKQMKALRKAFNVLSKKSAKP
ncbi:hypothetical protein BV378_15270 [Nostoc sp. RF31YmG]|nr:hypothetical protein BV378_15270 [Nostoc sp. RF31YmG]